MARVVVGVDGSENSLAALRWALANSAPDDDIVAITAWDIPTVTGVEGAMASIEGLADNAARILAETVAQVAPDGDPRLTTAVYEGHSGQVLIDHSANADLMVVGARGHGGFISLLVGSVATYAVHHARCPLVVVPGESD